MTPTPSQPDDIHLISIQMLPDGRMTPKNAALYMGLAEKTLAMKRCDGSGPCFTKVASKVFYKKSDLDTWIDEAGTFTSTRQAELYQAQQGGAS